MRLPYEYWLRYLVSVPLLSTAQVHDLCNLYRLPLPEETYLTYLRTSTTGGHGRLTSPAALRAAKIKALADGNADAVRARELLTEHRVRPTIEALLISGMSDKDVVFYLEGFHRLQLTEQAVAYYKHYFWNVDSLSNLEWEEFLDEYQSHHGKRLKQFLLRGPDFALWRLGHVPDLDAKASAKVIMHESMMRFRELSTYSNTQPNAMAAKMWAENFFKAAEFLDKDEDAVHNTISALSEFALKLGTREITSVHALSNRADGDKK